MTGGFGTGGAERELVCQLKALKALGHDLYVLTCGEGEPLEAEVKDMGIPLFYVGRRGSRLYRIGEIVRVLRRVRPRIVHSQHFYTNLYAGLGALGARAVGVGSLQNDFYSEVGNLGIWGRPSYRLLPWMTANSSLALERLRKAGYPGKRSFYVPNALDLERFDQLAEAQVQWDTEVHSSPLVITVGNLREQKRHDRLLRVFRYLLDDKVNARLAIVGSGDLEEPLRRMASDLNLDKYVRFLGRRMDVPALLRMADVFILCSDHEGMPNVVQEAMGAGLPCIVSRVGAVPELVREGIDGYVVAAEDEAGFVDRLRNLLNDPALRASMSAAARHRAETAFSLERLGMRLESMYRHMLGEHAPSTPTP